MNSLWFEGKANEYVLVIRNGELVKCGIGISGYKGIYDQIAKFPSTLKKVSFTTEQVTKEMQGLSVTCMFVWGIFRSEDGPFKAFKMLGSDLQSDVP